MNRRERRNCYNCRGFGYIAKNYRNREVGNRIGKERRLEYGGSKNNRQSNLNGEKDLIVFD